MKRTVVNGFMEVDENISEKKVVMSNNTDTGKHGTCSRST
jgi:hypothetical protein